MSNGDHEELRLYVDRSGFVGWQPGGGDLDLVLAPIGWTANWLTNLLVFRGGWTVYVVNQQTGKTAAKYRYAKRSAAEGDVRRLSIVHRLPPT